MKLEELTEEDVLKKCNKCKKHKHLSEFHKSLCHKYGRKPTCKICRSNYLKSKEGRRKNRIYWTSKRGKEIQKKYNQSKKAKLRMAKYRKSKKGRQRDLRYCLKYPEYRKAREAVNSAVRCGKILKSSNYICVCCNKKKAQQYHHHKGYASEHWLDIVPVCCTCHLILDQKREVA